MFQAVCVTKKRSLGQYEDEDEAVAAAIKHRKRSGHAIRVFMVEEEDKKATGTELINDEVDTAEEVEVPEKEKESNE